MVFKQKNFKNPNSTRKPHIPPFPKVLSSFFVLSSATMMLMSTMRKMTIEIIPGELGHDEHASNAREDDKVDHLLVP